MEPLYVSLPFLKKSATPSPTWLGAQAFEQAANNEDPTMALTALNALVGHVPDRIVTAEELSNRPSSSSP